MQLGASDARWFRGVLAKSNFAAQDRPDARCATTKMRREISAPTVGALRKPKRLARYPRWTPRARKWYKAQKGKGIVTAVADAYYAGREETRRSTSGDALKLGRDCVKSVECEAASCGVVNCRNRNIPRREKRGRAAWRTQYDA